MTDVDITDHTVVSLPAAGDYDANPSRPSTPKQRKIIKEESPVFEHSRASVRSLLGDERSQRCSTILTAFEFDDILFSSAVYRKYVAVS